MRGEIGMEDNIRTEVINAIIEGKSDYADELIEAHKPEYLYKYRSDSEYALDALRKKSVLISRATEMDDDADGRLYVSEDFKKMFEIAKNLIQNFKSLNIPGPFMELKRNLNRQLSLALFQN